MLHPPLESILLMDLTDNPHPISATVTVLPRGGDCVQVLDVRRHGRLDWFQACHIPTPPPTITKIKFVRTKEKVDGHTVFRRV